MVRPCVGVLYVVECSLVLITASSLLDLPSSERRSLCQWESENVTCEPGSVLVMLSASYGRMHIGRCLDNNFGHVTCSGDVLVYVDRQCSGRRACVLSLPDQALHSVPSSCPRDLEKYLEYSYTCVPVETSNEARCTAPVTVSSSSRGYLSNAMATSSSPGSARCPWLIRGLPGQTIRLELLDFGVWQGGWSPGIRLETSGLCRVYGEVVDGPGVAAGDRGAVTPLCGGQRRHKSVYRSETESVQVVIKASSEAPRPPYYLIHYRVVGCADLAPIPGARLRRLGDKTRVSCDESNKSWILTCDNNEWTGENATCEEERGGAWSVGHIIESSLALPQGVLIIIILCVAVLIAAVILTMGVCTLRRKRPGESQDAADVATDDDKDIYTRAANLKEQYPMLSKPSRLTLQKQSNYSTTLQRHLSVPASSRPLPVSPTLSECSTCPVHGAYSTSHDRRPASLSTFKPHTEHIYESPKFERRLGERHSVACTETVPYYHELEPDAAQRTPVFLAGIDPFFFPVDPPLNSQ